MNVEVKRKEFREAVRILIDNNYNARNPDYPKLIAFQPMKFLNELLPLIEQAGYCQVPELKVKEVPDHSESIWCPHCGEEFGVEETIESAFEAQRDYDLQQIEEKL